LFKGFDKIEKRSILLLLGGWNKNLKGCLIDKIRSLTNPVVDLISSFFLTVESEGLLEVWKLIV